MKQSVQKSIPEGHAIQRLEQAGNTVKKIFFVVFSVLFLFLFGNVLFNNMHFWYKPLPVIGALVVWLLLISGIYWLINRQSQWIVEKEKVVIPLFFLLLVVTQFLFYQQLAAYPTRDFERVFTGAVNFTENGFIQEPYLDYFYKYPNNMPMTIVLQFVFRVFHKLGYSNYYVLGALVNAVCMWVAYAFVYVSVRRLWGVGQGVFSLILMYASLPLQTYISIFYTDCFALPFAPFAFYMYLRAQDATSWKGKMLAGGLLAFGVAFGTAVKYSVVLVLVAILVDMLLRLRWKEFLGLAASFMVFFLLISAVFTHFMYRYYLEQEGAADKATPFLSWIMMGLKGDGAHNPEDNYIIWNWPTKQEKEQQAKEEIARRLKEHTPASFLRFLNQKSVRSFGSGNLDYTHTVADSPMRQTFLVECVSEGGKYFSVFDTITQGYHVAIFGLIIAGAILAVRKKEYEAFVPVLTILGLYLFLLLWESGQRYLLQYYGMFIVAAVAGIRMVWLTLYDKNQIKGNEKSSVEESI